MQVHVIDIGQEVSHKTAKGGYTSIEVTYKDNNNKVANKKLMSFGNAEVYKVFKNAKKGDVLDVVSEKDANNYWQWVGVSTGQAAPVTSVGSSYTAKSSGNTYETPEERAMRRAFEEKKQILIVRQSSIGYAQKHHERDKNPPSLEDVLATAEKINAWVHDIEVSLSKDSLEQEFDNDVPN